MAQQKFDVSDATLALAASVVDRTHDLIADGWVKGRMFTTVDGAKHEFCILGAIEQAVSEITEIAQRSRRKDIYDLATMFILDEAVNQYQYGGARAGWNSHGSIPGFNDAGNRTHDQVLNVLTGAAGRLWDLSVVNEQVVEKFEFSKWADQGVNDEAAKAYLDLLLA